MVLAGAGGVNHEDLCDLATKHFGKITDKYSAEVPIDLNCRYTGKTSFEFFRAVARGWAGWAMAQLFFGVL